MSPIYSISGPKHVLYEYVDPQACILIDKSVSPKSLLKK